MTSRHTVRLVLIALTSMGLLLGFVAPAEAGRMGDNRYEKRIVKLTNEKRTDRNMIALRGSACLDKYAEDWARKIARRGRLKHRSSEKFQAIMRECGFYRIGENLAVGNVPPKAIVRGWMHSRSHKRNITNPNYRRIAVGTVYRNGRYWTVQMFAGPVL